MAEPGVSLRDELRARGVRVADLAKELGESYGNLYTALDREHRGQDVRHSSVLARIEKVRDWLALERAAGERLATAVRGDEETVAALRRKVETAVVPASWTVETEWEGGALGDVLVGTGTLDGREVPCRWTFLRRVTTSSGHAWFDVWEVLGHETAEGKRHTARFRSVRKFAAPGTS